MITELAATSRTIALPQSLPQPRTNINIRPATLADLPFIDGLQNKHYKMVGYMWTKQLEGKIAAGHVLIAEENRTTDYTDYTDLNSESAKSAQSAVKTPVGYCIGNDQYFKHDDVGIIYQMNVAPDRQRGLIGATLVKAMFDRAAYGCRLFCCWCAQDLDSNYFWEALGFVPLAFRTGCQKRQRIHIFWQKRIRANDLSTPYWFPSETKSGAFKEDRLVLPIPPETHWKDAKPIVLPGAEQLPVVSCQLPAKKEKAKRFKSPLATNNSQLATISSGGLRFVAAKAEVMPKPKKEPRQKAKNDPRHVAAARELRDRWLERVNADPAALTSQGKYEVSKTLSAVDGSKALTSPSVQVLAPIRPLPARTLAA